MWTGTSGLLASLDTTNVMIFLLVFLLAWYYLSSPRNLPPGPPGLPIVGNMFSLKDVSSSLLAQFHKWHEQYGDVFTLRMGSKYVIVINSYKLAHETFVKHGDVFSGRPSHLYIIHQLIQKTGKGVIFTEGPVWKALRRVTLMTLRDFGVGKKSLEQRVQDEARAIVDELDKSEGQPTVVKPTMSKFSSNIICSVIFGSRFEYDDEVFLGLLERVNYALRQPAIFFPPNFVSLTRVVPSIGQAVDKFVNAAVEVDRHLEKLLKEHEKTYDADNIRDFVDLYIKMRSDQQDATLYNAANMRRVIIDLFIAGTETSATTMDWIIRYLIAYPHVQQRLQQSIDEVVGQDRLVTTEDKKKLPYVEAVFTEILRINPIAPLAVPHVAVREGSVGGYTVPAGSVVLVNLQEVHMDPRVWQDPHVFRPERFLDQQGHFLPPKENFIPFSTGPRTCLGETLARMEIFILMTTLLQFFTFTMPQGQKPNLEGKVGITYMPTQEPVIVKRR